MKNHLFTILLLSIFLTSGCAYYNTFFNAKKFFNEAENERTKREENVKKKGQVDQQSLDKPSANELKNYEKSIEKASKVLEIYPNSKYVDDALYLLGQCFYRKEDYEKAKRKFLELIENFPNSKLVPEGRLWLGKANIGLRDYQTAEQNFHDIADSKATDEIRDEAQFLLGGLFKHKGDYLTAIDEYHTAAKRASDKTIRANSYYEMGDCYYQLKNFSQAVESFKQARKYSPDAKFEFNSMFRAGLALKDLEKYDEAIKIFTNLLGNAVNEENWPACRLEIAHCQRLKKENDNAIEWYLDIIQRHAKTEEAAVAYFYLGKIYQEQKLEYEFAKEYFDKAVAENARASIVNEARARSKSIQTYLALKADIDAQKRKIAAGDSIAAAMDSLEISPQSSKLDPADSLIADTSDVYSDSSYAMRDASNQDFNNPDFKDGELSSRSNRNLHARNNPDNRNNPKQNEKLILKTGQLGSPQEELIKDKMLLAEIYLFEFNQPDSALKEYIDILEDDTLSKVIPKTLFSIAYICETFKHDTLLADSVYQRLINDYPKDPFTQQARKKIRTIKMIDPEQTIAEKFKKAESIYLDKNKYEDAISTFESIYESSPSSDYAPKALLTMGWIYENKLQETEKAFEIYQNLIQDYPTSSYAKKVKPKVDEVVKAQSQTKQAATATGEADSEIEADKRKAVSDTTQVVDISTMDREQYRRYLRQEMEKNDPRRKTPRRL